MNRRDFIKHGTGGIPVIRVKVFFIAVIVLIFLLLSPGKLANDSFVTSAFPALEKENTLSSFISFLKLCGIVFGALVVLTLLQLVTEYASKKIASLIPLKIKNWWLNHKKQLRLLYYISISSFFIYYCLLQDQYLLLIVGQVWIVFSFFKKSPEASHTN